MNLDSSSFGSFAMRITENKREHKMNLKRITKILPAFLLVACTADVGDDTFGSASGSLSSLPGSTFEIDDDSNLTVDGITSDDWASVDDLRTTDVPSGTSDNSFGGGTKEDTVCPKIVTGSIPNNKSDLLSFGAWKEPGSPGYLHLFWTRVQEPSGTTLIDFELNQSTTDCGNGVNKERTPGDILIEYRIEQGGAVATIKFREWSGVEWGPEVDLTAAGLATGTINNTAIEEADSDGLGALSVRTFGEATIDLSFIFDSNVCRSFGSAFVKSRSSDSFTSQLKDFIAPVPIDLTNCGEVTIRKVTLPSGRTETFTFTHNIASETVSGTSFVLSDGGSQVFSSALLGTGYSVTEAETTDFELVDIDCSASTAATLSTDVSTRTVSFDLANTSDVVDCTFTNRLRRGSFNIQKFAYHEATGPSAYPQAGVNFTVEMGDTSFVVTTDENGSVCVPNLEFGTWTVTEIVPEGYSALSSPQTVDITSYNDCPTAQTVGFYNQPLTNLVCTVDSQIPGGTLSRIDCTGGVSSELGDDVTVALTDLMPGVYTCTVTVNP